MKSIVTTERVPIKIWATDLEPGALEQAKNVANLPFVYKWVSVMADGHVGYGVPIGSVVATDGVYLPAAVGVDIGCGLAFMQTNIPAELMSKPVDHHGILVKGIIGNIKRSIPVGFSHHREKQPCLSATVAESELWVEDNESLRDELGKVYYQVGTLGGGNHFIELQKDENGLLAVMIHSGSRNFGKQVGDYYTKVAKKLNTQWYSDVDTTKDLCFLPADTKEGAEYFRWMTLALKFAQENRDIMMRQCLSVIMDMVKKYDGFSGIETEEQINIHHNYAAIEHHYGRNVIVHRKGATKATEKTVGIIPGSMGTASHIVRGRGNPESFQSCSHGAGRRMGRKEAQRSLNLQEERERLAGIEHDMTTVDKLDEAAGAYKDISVVMENQSDLVEIIKTLKPVAVIKG